MIVVLPKNLVCYKSKTYNQFLHFNESSSSVKQHLTHRHITAYLPNMKAKKTQMNGNYYLLYCTVQFTVFKLPTNLIKMR